jgi:predicted DNA-binding transcriptional regulator AlpA
MMRRQTAAAYLDLSIPEFEREVAAARLPQPVKLGNHEHWSKIAIDDAVARLSGERGGSWREKAALYADAG